MGDVLRRLMLESCFVDDNYWQSWRQQDDAMSCLFVECRPVFNVVWKLLGSFNHHVSLA